VTGEVENINTGKILVFCTHNFRKVMPCSKNTNATQNETIWLTKKKKLGACFYK
jgi:hypothetical protein